MFTNFTIPGALHSIAASYYQQIQSLRFADFDASRGPSHDLSTHVLAEGKTARPHPSWSNDKNWRFMENTIFYQPQNPKTWFQREIVKYHEVSKQITNRKMVCLPELVISQLGMPFFTLFQWQYLAIAWALVSEALKNPKFNVKPKQLGTCCTWTTGEKHVVPLVEYLPVCLSLSASPSGGIE